MSDDIRKKEIEIQILKKVFGEEVTFEQSEQPDFIVKYGTDIEHGVEITELYYDGTSARIKNGAYLNELITKQKFRHKDDKKKLKVHDIEYYAQTRNFSPVRMPALFLPKYNMHDYVRTLENAIMVKNKKLKKYSPRISESCMLIIYDRENPFINIHEKDIAKQLFLPSLSEAVRKSNYQEIYLVTGVDKQNRYIPLKSYLLQSDFLLFMEFIKDRGLAKELEQVYAHPLFAFAEILTRRGNVVHFGSVTNEDVIGKIVVYCGRYGIGLVSHDNDNWGVGIFDTFPQQTISDDRIFVLDPNSDFFDDVLYTAYEETVQTKVASTGLFFRTK